MGALLSRRVPPLHSGYVPDAEVHLSIRDGGRTVEWTISERPGSAAGLRPAESAAVDDFVFRALSVYGFQRQSGGNRGGLLRLYDPPTS